MISLEFLVKTQKWFCICPFKSPSENENYFFEIFSKVLSKLTRQYDNVIVLDNAKIFLKLIDKHFPLSHKPNKIYSRNTTKFNYSCMDASPK